MIGNTSLPYKLFRPTLHLGREAAFWARAGLQLPVQGGGPLVVFLPAYGRTGAALLRIYNIALGLRQQGWSTYVLAPKLTLAQRRRCLRILKPDVVVMQGARHALNRPEFYSGQRIVYDIDDAAITASLAELVLIIISTSEAKASLTTITSKSG